MRLQQLCTPAVTIDEALSSFMLHQQSSRHSPMTIRRYEYTLGKFRAFLGSQDLLEQVTPSLLRGFMVKLEGTVKPNTLLGVMRDVKAFLRFCEREEIIEKNPIYKITMPKVDSTILPALTEEEFGCLLSSCSGRDAIQVRNKTLFILMLDTRLRLSEVAGIKVGGRIEKGQEVAVFYSREKQDVPLDWIEVSEDPVAGRPVIIKD